MSSPRDLSFAKAVNEAISQSMAEDKDVICFGLGTDDPRGVFGTTLGLQDKFGSERVFDMPTSENGMTGVAIGMALYGLKPIMTHQRLDFFLLALDQLINNAAKWHYMFGGQHTVPITIRLILGRGWGQGPTHSQSLQAWFAHVPGLKVVMPSNPYDAKGLLIESIFDPNPVLFLEHRWLHEMQAHVPTEMYRIPFGKAKVVEEGSDITIVSMSYMTIETVHALETLKKYGIRAELIDLRSVSPIDWDTIFNSVKKTGRLLVVDTANITCSVSSEIISRVTTTLFDSLKQAPQQIALPDVPVPTSCALTQGYYKRAEDVAQMVGKMLGKEIDTSGILASRSGTPHDVPGNWFKGPF